MPTHLTPQTPFVRRYLVVMGVLTLAAIFGVLALRAGLRERAMAAQNGAPATGVEQPLPEIGAIGEFTLTDQTGTAFSASLLAGRIYVADFFFTSCSGICPVMSKAMAEVQQEFINDPRVSFVSISVDPATDTPDVLTRYAARYGAQPGRWHFLTGDAEEIQRLAKDRFLLGYGDEPVNHSARFVLVDGAGLIRGYYFGTEPASIEALQHDIRRLLVENGS
jgi:protein SCO1/2